MALRQLNKYSNVGHTDVDAMFLTLDKTFKGLRALSLTEWNTTARPSIAAGSVVECNGALFIADIDEAIAENPPDGVVYVKLIPSGSPISLTAMFTEVAPVWSDSKQGWYSPAAGEESQVYVAGCHKLGTLFSGKGYFDNETPVGGEFDFCGQTIRFPYMLGYGQALSRVDFAVAFTHFGIAHGAGDGYSTFNAPDFRGRMSIGLDNQGGTSANRVTAAAADTLGGSSGNENASGEVEYGGSGGWAIYQGVMNPYLALYKAFKFI
jgi:hypothetical protein